MPRASPPAGIMRPMAEPDLSVRLLHTINVVVPLVFFMASIYLAAARPLRPSHRAAGQPGALVLLRGHRTADAPRAGLAAGRHPRAAGPPGRAGSLRRALAGLPDPPRPAWWGRRSGSPSARRSRVSIRASRAPDSARLRPCWRSPPSTCSGPSSSRGCTPLARRRDVAPALLLAGLLLVFAGLTTLWVRVEQRSRALEPFARVGRGAIGLLAVVIGLPVVVLMPLFWLESHLPLEAVPALHLGPMMALLLVCPCPGRGRERGGRRRRRRARRRAALARRAEAVSEGRGVVTAGDVSLFAAPRARVPRAAARDREPPAPGCGTSPGRWRRPAIGSVVIVGDDGAPVGIVTDRDLRGKVVAAGRDPAATAGGGRHVGAAGHGGARRLRLRGAPRDDPPRHPSPGGRGRRTAPRRRVEQRLPAAPGDASGDDGPRDRDGGVRRRARAARRAGHRAGAPAGRRGRDDRTTSGGSSPS